MIRKPSLLLAASVLSVFALSGCGDGTVRTGAAAVVGDERITTSTLDGYVTRGLKSPEAQQGPGTDKAAFEREVLGRLVAHEILLTASHDQGVSATGGEIDALKEKLSTQLAQSGQAQDVEQAALRAGIAPEDLRETLEDVVLKDKLADKLTEKLQVPDSALREGYQQNIGEYDKVDSAHILVATKKAADSLLAQARAKPESFGALAAKHSTDTGSKANGGELGFQGRGALVKEFEDAIFSNKQGAIVQVKTQFGFHVIKVGERRTTSFEQAKVELRRNLLSAERNNALSAFLQKTSKVLGVHINPRFGVWDPATQEVVEPKSCPSSDTVSPSPRPGDAAAPDAEPEPSASPDC